VLKEFRERLSRDTEALDAAGLLKRERVIGSAQGPVVRLADGREMINLCANNYLGLANHPTVLQAAHEGLARYGYGVASVRFICGTQSVHRELEERLSAYLSMEDTILYSSCFDANGGLFETLLDEQDAVISDALNHASIINSNRLCKARRLRYANNDMNELEQSLKDSQGSRVRLIATDGVFSMDGSIARLKEICDLADRYGALVMIDDSHATGFIGARGRGVRDLQLNSRSLLAGDRPVLACAVDDFTEPQPTIFRFGESRRRDERGALCLGAIRTDDDDAKS